jgi:hypothetical protein
MSQVFELKSVDVQQHNRQAKKALFRITGLFFLIGLPMSMGFTAAFGSYFSNHFVSDFIGAFIGLVITLTLVNTVMKDQPWLQPLQYSWALKRAVMKIYNRLQRIEARAEEGDVQALEVMAFYFNALEQMHQLEGNSHELVEIRGKKREWLPKFEEAGVNPDLNRLDLELIEQFNPV